jgi:putative cell wall-binding protein
MRRLRVILVCSALALAAAPAASAVLEATAAL